MYYCFSLSEPTATLFMSLFQTITNCFYQCLSKLLSTLDYSRDKFILPRTKRRQDIVLSDRRALLARKMSFALEKSRSTAALDGIPVLYFTNRRWITTSLLKALSDTPSSLRQFPSSHDLRMVRAFAFGVFWLSTLREWVIP